MTLTIATIDLIGPGIQFTFGAADDQFYIREGVMVASTNTLSPLGGTSLESIILTIAGDLVVPRYLEFSGQDAEVTILETGTLSGYDSGTANPAVFLSGIDGNFANYGTLNAPNGIGFLARASGNSANNQGVIHAASPVFIFISSDSQVVNGGTLTATTRDDFVRSDRYNNGVFVDQSVNVTITNLATGVITAVGDTGAGVRFALDSGGSRLNNAGLIESLLDFGVNLASLSIGQATVSVFNTGTIIGTDGAYNGSVNADSVQNRGVMNGVVVMGTGHDTFDNRGGTINGNWFGGVDDDFYHGSQNALVNGEIFGGDGHDTLLGGDNEDVIYGGIGDDSLRGRADEDILFGDDGDDIAYGGADDDALYGGNQQDTLYGGAGDDTVFGGSHEDLIYGGADDDDLFGDGSSDTIYGGAGSDTIDGGGSADTVYGGAGDDTVDGGTNNDVVSGGFGNDVLLGNTGNDSLYGGWGRDTMTGGDGEDVFYFNTSPVEGEADEITDFIVADDTIRLDDAAFAGLATGVLAGAAFAANTTGLATTAAHRLVYETDTGRLYFDEDGTGSAARIHVATLDAGLAMTAADFFVY